MSTPNALQNAPQNSRNEDAAGLVLAVDTSGADAGIVLAGVHGFDVALLPVREDGIARTEDLAFTAETLLRKHGRSAGDLTAVAGVVGPGSYTGLRSGLAFLRGLAFADSLPCVAVGALELLAYRAGRPGESLTVVWPIGKGRQAVAAYACGSEEVTELVAPAAVDDADVPGVVAANVGRAVVLATLEAPTDAMAAAAAHASLEVRVADSCGLTALAMLVRAKLARGKAAPVETMLPFYVGQAAARPNTHRVAAPAATPDRPE